MRFKSFSFRAEWLEAADALGDAALKAELLLAITTYGLTGEYTLSSSPVINALMVVIKAQIDAAPSRRKAIKEQAEQVSVADTSERDEEESPTPQGVGLYGVYGASDYLAGPMTNTSSPPRMMSS